MVDQLLLWPSAISRPLWNSHTWFSREEGNNAKLAVWLIELGRGWSIGWADTQLVRAGPLW